MANSGQQFCDNLVRQWLKDIMSMNKSKVFEDALDELNNFQEKAMLYYRKILFEMGPEADEAVTVGKIKTEIHCLVQWVEDLVCWALEDSHEISSRHQRGVLLYQQEN
ncbi:hypothetical protein BDP27DRAFT_1369602 [Rhodocollybia butyracea]|uniref:Uncharacterized protein n=1 Tax=Rhodocollybia butyracea TaxID=206335 RepID=A0A9P5U0J7_9AGAR|nr:hypothetical protein BDP27DRAFT_1369602 [Rhodocollybia butyracea]